MAGALVVLDFQGAEAGNEEAGPAGLTRLTVHAASTTLVARDPWEVRPTLDEVDAWCRGGGYAFGAVAYEAASAFDAAYPARGDVTQPLLAFHLVQPEGVVRSTPGTTESSVPLYESFPQWTPAESRERHAAVVSEIRERIASGDVYQVNHTVRLRAPWSGSSLPFYEALYEAHRPPYGAWMRFGELELLSMSPELFLERRGVELATRPMKGTARRGRFIAEDLARRDALLASEKERAENVMIVDLLRNDLGRLALPGGVSVRSLLDAERHSTVWQLTSTVVATCAEPPSVGAAFAALFPSGSITGAPRIAAMRQIARLEPDPRGFYCGASGMVTPGGDFVFNVAIRTVQVDREHGVATYGTGGGITWDSQADAEFGELHAKAVLASKPVPRFELLETLRLEDGRFPLLQRHLARLRRSATHFGWEADIAGVEEMLQAVAAGNDAGLHRVRLLVPRDGEPSVTVAPHSPDTRPWNVCLASEPVDAEDVFLFHKTTRREVHEGALRDRPDADDVILWNRSGRITELTRANLVLELDGVLVTPPVEDGLLAGVQRELAISERGVRELSLSPGDLEHASAAWAINALRGWVPVIVRPR